MLGFDTHITNICNRVRKKLHALARISQFMIIRKRRMIMKAFIASEFSYCTLAWMFHSRKSINRVNKFHERALRLVCQNYASSFTKFLEKEISTTICNRNIQLLTTELLKAKNGLSPTFMNEVFVENAHHYYDLGKKLNLRETMLKMCTTVLNF